MQKLLLVTLFTIVSCTLAFKLSPKALNGPPSEFASHRLPDPSMGVISSDAAEFLVELSSSSDDLAPSVTQKVMADSTTGLSVSVFAPLLDELSFKLVNPNGEDVDFEGQMKSTYMPATNNESMNKAYQGKIVDIANPMVGEYLLTVSAPSLTLKQLKAKMAAITAVSHHAVVFVFNQSPDMIASHMTHYQTAVSKAIGLNTRMFDSVAHGPFLRGVVPKAVTDVVTTAQLDVLFPDGHIETEPMHDDGLHFDGDAADGAFGAQVIPSQPGLYMLQAYLSGTNANGKFTRTTQHLVNVVETTISLTGRADAALHLLEDRMVLKLQVKDSDPSKRYRTYAEVYGTTVDGKTVPVAWASTISSSSKNTMDLEVDLRWFVKAKAFFPITLQNVYMQSASESMVPVAEEQTLTVRNNTRLAAHLVRFSHIMARQGYTGEVSATMRQGHPPARLLQSRAARANGTAANSGKVMLVHGYCASGNPFEENPSDWTDAIFFKDLNQARPLDGYSELIQAFAASEGAESYGLVGHSMGGMASVHTLNYYHDGLDNAVGERKVQSLASPYYGNSAIGSADTLKNLFGSGCGAIYDLTVDGATLWMAGITTETRSQVNFYITQYDKGGLFGQGYCNLLMNSLLSKPNDGATENSRAVLENGINRGITVGQCHIKDMEWPASYYDHTRNQEMSAAAAR